MDNPAVMINVDPQTQAETWYYYYADALGSIRLLTDAAGYPVESYTYDPYGQPYVMTSAGADNNWLTEDYPANGYSNIGNPYLFTGRRWDSTTKLYYYRFRDYAPTLGRFCQTDPAGYIDTMNLYAYCANNPVNWIDPWGLFQFGRRDLAGAPSYSRYFTGPLMNALNLGSYHKAGFYEDGSGDVANFGGGRNEDRSQYTMRGRHYDDDLMRQAQANVDATWKERGPYDVVHNNCQDYNSALRKEYKRLEKEKKKKEKEMKEKGEKDPKKNW